MTHKNTEGEAV